MLSWRLHTLLVSIVLAAARAQDCYLPNGTTIEGLRVCNPNAAFSACCAPGDECTTNGFCKAGSDAANNWLWRGTCTDPTWKSSLCPQHCYNSTTSPSASSINHLVLACSPDQYCCGYESETYDPHVFSFDCCSDKLRLFSAGPAEYLAGYPVTTSIFLGFTSISTLPTSIATSSTATIATTVITTSTTLTTSTSSNTGSATATSAAASSTTSANASSGLSAGAQAGIGIGAAIGAIALIALGIFVGLRMKRTRPVGILEYDEHRKDSMTMPPPRYEKPLATSVVEAGGWQRPTEADSNVRVELEGNSMDWRAQQRRQSKR